MSKIYKKKTSPYWWWTGRYKGKRYRRSLKVSKKSHADKIKEIMETVLSKKETKGVPIVANAETGDNWGDMKEL